MPNCRDLHEFIYDYVEGHLPGDVAREFEYHLQLCPNCIAYLNTYRKTVEYLGTISPPEMPPELKEILYGMIKRRSD